MYNIVYVIPMISLVMNRSKINPRYIRVILYSSTLLTLLLFLNILMVFVIKPTHTWSPVLVLQVVFFTSCLNYILGKLFNKFIHFTKKKKIHPLKAVIFCVVFYIMLIINNVTI